MKRGIMYMSYPVILFFRVKRIFFCRSTKLSKYCDNTRLRPPTKDSQRYCSILQMFIWPPACGLQMVVFWPSFCMNTNKTAHTNKQVYQYKYLRKSHISFLFYLWGLTGLFHQNSAEQFLIYLRIYLLNLLLL